MRAERCACRGWIVAPSLEEAEPAVQEHQRSPEHATWRALEADMRPATPSYELEKVMSRPAPWRAPAAAIVRRTA